MKLTLLLISQSAFAAIPTVDLYCEHHNSDTECEKRTLYIESLTEITRLFDKIKPGFDLNEADELSVDLTPIDGIMLDSELAKYLSHISEEIPQSLIASHSDSFVAAVFRRRQEWIRESLRKCEADIQASIRSQIEALDRQIESTTALVETLALELDELYSSFKYHCDKFRSVRSVMKTVQKTPSSPFKPLGGFDQFRSNMTTLVRQMHESTDEEVIDSCRHKIIDQIRRLKRYDLDPKTIWKICREAFETIIERPDDKVRIKSLRDELIQHKTALAKLEHSRGQLSQ